MPKSPPERNDSGEECAKDKQSPMSKFKNLTARLTQVTREELAEAENRYKNNKSY